MTQISRFGRFAKESFSLLNLLSRSLKGPMGRRHGSAQLGQAEVEQAAQPLEAPQDSLRLEQRLFLRGGQVQNLAQGVDEGGVLDPGKARRRERLGVSA